MATKAITDESFDSDVIKSNKPTVVDFWAEWCGPCKQIGPVLEEISDEMKDQVVIAKHNIDQEPNTPTKYGIKGIPNIIQLQKGINEIRRVLKNNCLTRIYIKTKKDTFYKLSKLKKSSLLRKRGWEKGMTLTFLSEKQVKNFFRKFRKIKIGIEEFNHINHKKKHSFWVITAKK